jgi:hypothetical protein
MGAQLASEHSTPNLYWVIYSFSSNNGIMHEVATVGERRNLIDLIYESAFIISDPGDNFWIHDSEGSVVFDSTNPLEIVDIPSNEFDLDFN